MMLFLQGNWLVVIAKQQQEEHQCQLAISKFISRNLKLLTTQPFFGSEQHNVNVVPQTVSAVRIGIYPGLVQD